MTTRRFSAPDHDLDAFYGDIAELDLQPLWLIAPMGKEPPARDAPHVWRWKDVKTLCERGGELITIDRGGDRRVLALCNPSLGEDKPYATSTLWAAVQYLKPGEVAPAHRHSPAALRFVLEGSGVWTRVQGDAVTMEPGDLVLTPSWTFHEHHNPGDEPMIWFDALDIPVVEALDAVFFQRSEDSAPNHDVPDRSASEIAFAGGPGLIPTGERPALRHSPLFRYPWADTDRALSSLVESNGGQPAAIRFVDPTNGRDVMPTMRCEMVRIPEGSTSGPTQTVGSAVLVVYRGAIRATVGTTGYDLGPGDMVAVPSWAAVTLTASETADIFSVSDGVIMEALGLDRPSPGAAR